MIPTVLDVETPEGVEVWSLFKGLVVLKENKFGAEYKYEGEFYKGRPIFVYRLPSNKAVRVYRDGDVWHITGQIGEMSKRREIQHMSKGDANLPPSGLGWQRELDGTPSSISFSVARGFEDAVKTVVGSRAKRTALGTASPQTENMWAPLTGTVILIDHTHGFEFVYDGQFHLSHPTYVSKLPSGKEIHVFRDGDAWFSTGGNGRGSKTDTIGHIAGGDPHLPPTGKGWVRVATRVANDELNFGVAPGLETKFAQVQGMAAHATKLALRTPEDEHAWSPLIGTAVLLENKYGALYVYGPWKFHHGYPTYVFCLPSGKECRVFREGNIWYNSGWSSGNFSKFRQIDHDDRSDPNLPPSGVGWTRCEDGTPSTISFSVAPGFEKKLEEASVEWSGAKARPTQLSVQTPRQPKQWQLFLFEPVLFENKYGCLYKFLGEHHDGHPIYVFRLPSGKETRVYRKGDVWVNTTGAKSREIKHMGGDTNLPPTGKGWVRPDGTLSTLSFSVADGFERKLKTVAESYASATWG